ncbi:MAG: hypothetical protein ACRD8A_16830 [Candidatus Acidiferrales bacterium]
MRPPAAIALLVLSESVLLAIPLLPAIDELLRKRDAKPLEVIQKHAGDITYFARGFRSYLAPLLERLRQCTETRSNGWGRLKNGEEYLLLGDDRQSFIRAARLHGPTCEWLVAAGTNVTFPNGLTFAKEIYSAKPLVSGERNAFRAILCDEDVHLRRGSETMRWAHAVGRFRADCGCGLYGRVSSDREILLSSGCTFQRLHAPHIVLGSAPDERPANREPASNVTHPLARRLIDGDFEIRPGEVMPENLVARGTLRIGAGARMLGSAKGHRSVVLEEKAVVCGSLISSGELYISRDCRIGGPILAERRIEISSGTVCGMPEAPTTVSSPVVHATEGSSFHGTLWARETGRVVARL